MLNCSSLRPCGMFVAAVVGMALLWPDALFGAAAQQASGSKKVKTSESVKPTDPALDQIDAVFDPSVEDFAIQSFDLSVLYDTSLVTVNSITLDSPFIVPPGAPAATMDSTGIHNIEGEDAFVEDDGSGSPNSDVSNENLFEIDFDLKPGVPADTPVSFELIASDPGNFIMALDSTLADPTLAADVDFSGDDVDDSVLTASDTAGEISDTDLPDAATVPLPAAAWQGAMGAVLLAAYLRRRRPVAAG